MDLVKYLDQGTLETLEDVTNQIYSEMRGIVGEHSRSGEALASIHVEAPSKYARFIGGTNLHLYFLDEGNGTGGIPKHGKPRAPMPLTYGYKGLRPVGYAMHVNNYKGIHFVEWIASRHS